MSARRRAGDQWREQADWLKLAEEGLKVADAAKPQNLVGTTPREMGRRWKITSGFASYLPA